MDPPLWPEIKVKMVRAKTEGLSLPPWWCIGSCDTTESIEVNDENIMQNIIISCKIPLPLTKNMSLL